MELLNKLGKEVMQYKVELDNKTHSDIVRKSLLSSTTSLLSNGIIDVDVHDVIKDDEASYEEVREMVLKASNLTKTEDELKGEYDEYRVPFFDKLLESYDLSNDKQSTLSSESYVKGEEIQLILTFKMTKDFIGDYFERSGEQLDVMMRPEGFAEKFAILRYGALVSKFLRGHANYSDENKRAVLDKGIEIGATKVFVNKDEETYGVEFVYHLPIENLLDEDKSKESLEIAGKSIEEALEFVKTRTIA